MSRLRYACLVMFYVTYGYMIYRAARLPWTGPLNCPGLEFLIYVSNMVLLLATFVIDAKVRRHPLSDGMKLIVYATFPISMAVYLIWSRGWRGILWLVFHLFLLVVVFTVSTSIANAITIRQLEIGEIG